MTTIDQLAFSIFNSKGTYALLLGSGVSKNSGIPTGWDITLDLINKVVALSSESTDDPVGWYIEKFSEEPDYSNLLEKLAKTSTERLNILKPYFESETDDLQIKPSVAHKAIAKLIKKGYFKVILTTNFDRLLETAIRSENIEPQIIRHSSDIEGATPLVHSNLTLIKINGDYLDNRFLNTKEELENYDSLLNNYIQNVFNDYGVVSCGWSGKWDNGLINTIKSTSNFRYNNYWCSISEQNTELQEIANLRKGELYKINSADEFFNELLAKIEAIETFKQTDILSLDIAVARVKKYLSKDEFIIQLNDLLISEVKKVESQIIKIYDPSLYPNKENLAPILKQYEFSITNFLPLIINTAYWSKPNHNPLITNLIARLCKNIERPGGHYDESRNLRYIPSLTIFYAVGIIAVSTKKYNLLNECFKIKIAEWTAKNSKISCLKVLNCSIVDKSIFNQILEQNFKTPISTYINRYLKPYMSEIFIDEISYQENFDLFEYLLSLNYLEYAGKRHGYDWIPCGEFAWRRHEFYREEKHIIDNFIGEMVAEKENLLILKSGMFDSSYQKLDDLISRTDNFLKDIRF